jgi:hypothetical protein
LALAAVVLIAGEAKKSGDPEAYVTNFDSNDALSDSENLAVGLAVAAMKNADSSESLKNILGTLGFKI